MATEWGDPDPQAALEKLAAELDSGQYAVSLVTSAGRRPHLYVCNRAAAQLTESIYSEAGWYWWSWAERIVPVWNVAAAAGAITRVLGALDGCRGA